MSNFNIIQNSANTIHSDGFHLPSSWNWFQLDDVSFVVNTLETNIAHYNLFLVPINFWKNSSNVFYKLCNYFRQFSIFLCCICVQNFPYFLLHCIFLVSIRRVIYVCSRNENVLLLNIFKWSTYCKFLKLPSFRVSPTAQKMLVHYFFSIWIYGYIDECTLFQFIWQDFQLILECKYKNFLIPIRLQFTHHSFLLYISLKLINHWNTVLLHDHLDSSILLVLTLVHSYYVSTTYIFWVLEAQSRNALEIWSYLEMLFPPFPISNISNPVQTNCCFYSHGVLTYIGFLFFFLLNIPEIFSKHKSFIYV